MQQRLRISLKDGVNTETLPRLTGRDLKFELNGEDIGNRLVALSFDMDKDHNFVAKVNLTLYLNEIDIDIPLADGQVHEIDPAYRERLTNRFGSR